MTEDKTLIDTSPFLLQLTKEEEENVSLMDRDHRFRWLLPYADSRIADTGSTGIVRVKATHESNKATGQLSLMTSSHKLDPDDDDRARRKIYNCFLFSARSMVDPAKMSITAKFHTNLARIKGGIEPQPYTERRIYFDVYSGYRIEVYRKYYGHWFLQDYYHKNLLHAFHNVRNDNAEWLYDRTIEDDDLTLVLETNFNINENETIHFLVGVQSEVHVTTDDYEFEAVNGISAVLKEVGAYIPDTSP